MLRLALVFLLLTSGTAHALPLDVTCRVPGVHDPDVIRTVHAVGLSLRVSDKVMLAGFEAGWVESHMNNLSCGDRDSLGVFQQRPSMGWGTPEQIMDVSYAARRFFEYAVRVDRPSLSAGMLADAVQRSCCPERYDQAVGRAESMLRQAWQGGPEVVGGVVHVVADGDVRADGVRLSSSQDFVGRPSVAGRFVFARTARGEVRVLADQVWRVVASGVAGDPEAVVRPDGTVEVFAILGDGSVAKLSDPLGMIGMGGGSPQGARQSVSIPTGSASSQADSSRRAPSQVNSGVQAPSQTASSEQEPNQAASSRQAPNQASSGVQAPSRAVSSQADSSKQAPSQTVPTWQTLSPPGFATGKPSAILHPDGSTSLYIRSGDKLMATATATATTWREIASGLEASPEAVLRPDGTIGVHTLIGGRPHRLTTTWEPLTETRCVDTVSAQPDGTVHAHSRRRSDQSRLNGSAYRNAPGATSANNRAWKCGAQAGSGGVIPNSDASRKPNRG
ncbi:hypothetical protein GCM10017774_47600 [Lentzea cavernae]|uniref:Uncharacterized protein n=1 Tax=Lentzea cavernae TaxID=2020703 RepID=A0ABQ3MHX5_9PSEU|nr:hypothetical protein GCM10017774_47600 [Lentzea cavernae]